MQKSDLAKWTKLESAQAKNPQNWTNLEPAPVQKSQKWTNLDPAPAQKWYPSGADLKNTFSNRLEAHVAVEPEGRTVPVRDSCAPQDGPKSGPHQLTYIGQRSTRLEMRVDVLTFYLSFGHLDSALLSLVLQRAVQPELQSSCMDRKK